MVTLDGKALFDSQDIEIRALSFRRAFFERTIAGVDGVLSIDLGNRGRKVRQSGVLRSASRSQMEQRLKAISAFMDGAAHVLVTSSGEQLDNLRMDSFEVSEARASGGGVVVDYEIVYRQLV